MKVILIKDDAKDIADGLYYDLLSGNDVYCGRIDVLKELNTKIEELEPVGFSGYHRLSPTPDTYTVEQMKTALEVEISPLPKW